MVNIMSQLREVAMIPECLVKCQSDATVMYLLDEINI